MYRNQTTGLNRHSGCSTKSGTTRYIGLPLSGSEAAPHPKVPPAGTGAWDNGAPMPWSDSSGTKRVFRRSGSEPTTWVKTGRHSSACSPPAATFRSATKCWRSSAAPPTTRRANGRSATSTADKPGNKSSANSSLRCATPAWSSSTSGRKTTVSAPKPHSRPRFSALRNSRFGPYTFQPTEEVATAGDGRSPPRPTCCSMRRWSPTSASRSAPAPTGRSTFPCGTRPTTSPRGATSACWPCSPRSAGGPKRPCGAISSACIPTLPASTSPSTTTPATRIPATRSGVWV